MLLVTDNRYHCEKSIIVLGMFDGVHIGHRVLIQKGRALAGHRHLPLIVCTFANHPMDVIAPERSPKILTTLKERAEEMEKLGVDVLVAQEFTQSVMVQPPEEYIGALVQRFHPTDVVCGYNHSFGKNGEGKPAFLEALGGALGFKTWIVPQIKLNGREVSSTEIRKALSNGEIPLANRLLGRAYALEGKADDMGLFVPSIKKQLPRDGRYRCVLQSGENVFPCTARIDESAIRLVTPLPSGECSLRFLAGV